MAWLEWGKDKAPTIDQQLHSLREEVTKIEQLIAQSHANHSKNVGETIEEFTSSFNSRLEQLSATISDNRTEFDEKLNSLNTKFDKLNSQLIQLAKSNQNTDTPDLLKYSDEPWFQFNGGRLDPVNGIELSIDWNNAFIAQLKRNGYNGMNDMQIISKWIAAVAGQQQAVLFGGADQ